MPFTVAQFFEVFRAYNEAVFPAQFVLVFLAIVAVSGAWLAGHKRAGMLVTVILATLWLWIGAVYHLLYFAEINPVAYLFAFAFIVQGFIFLFWGLSSELPVFQLRANVRGIAGIVLIVYALLAYPVIGYSVGHVYPASPTFGVPCPTTIFTFGVLLFAKQRVSVYVFAIPFVWSLIGASAAFLLSVPEDFGLLASGVICCYLLFAGRYS